MDRIQEIDKLIATLYGQIHSAVHSIALGKSAGLNQIDELVGEVARLAVERAKWTSK